MDFIKKYWGLFVILLICYAAVRSVFLDGFFPVHDDVQPTRIFQMAKSIMDGMFPVRWVNDLGFGYGYPIFNFYAPLPYYLGALFYFLGFDAINSAKIMFAIPVFLAGIGMYLFVRAFLGQLPAMLSAAVFVLFPYFALNIFVRGAVGEYYAYSFLPFIFWGLFRIYYLANSRAESKKSNIDRHATLFESLYIRPAAISIIFLSFLIISHNLSAYMLFIFLLFYFAIAFFYVKNKMLLIINFGTILLISFLITSFYTLPAMFEIKFTDVSSQLAGNFDFSKHYVCPLQWWDSPWGFAGSSEGCVEDGISFRLGKSNIIFALLGIAAFILFSISRGGNKKNFMFFYALAVLAISLFMMTEYSKVVWSYLPGIDFLQFPWRFLNFAGFAIAVLSGYFVYAIINKNRSIGTIILIAAVLSTVYFNLKLFQPQTYLNSGADHYINIESIVFLHSKLTNEYMPPNFERPKNKSEVPNKPIEVISGMGSVEVIENRTGKVSANVEMKQEGSLRINKAFFPAWKLFSNRTELKLIEDERGMTAMLDKGNHYISLEFVPTPIHLLGNGLSISGIIVLLAVIIKSGKNKYYGQEN